MWKCELNEWNFIRFIPLVKVSNWRWEIHLAYARQKRETATAPRKHTPTKIHTETDREGDKQTTKQTDSQSRPRDKQTERHNKPKANALISAAERGDNAQGFPFSSSRGKLNRVHHTYIFIYSCITVCLLGPDVARHSNSSLCVRVTKPNKI